MPTEANIQPGYASQAAPVQTAPVKGAAKGAAVAGGIWVALFLICVAQPFNFTIGGVLLSPLRLFILAATLPLSLAMLRGGAGRLVLPDYLLLGYVLWMPVPVFLNHGAAAPVPLLVMTMLETMTPYMLARVIIRDAASFRFFGRWMLGLVALMLPFVVIQALTDRNLLTEIYRLIPGIDVFRQVQHDQRLGLYRAQGSFEHPILYGLFCAIPFALAWRALFPSPAQIVQRLVWTGISGLAVFFSLSSGPLFAVFFQMSLLGYDIVMRNLKARWKLFAVLVVLAYLLGVALIEANPILYVISNMTFSGGSAWNRVRIWQLGTDVVAANPIFGIAYRDWPRPAWMPSSVDNYWLLIAMRYGLVGFALFTGAVLATLIRAARTDLSSNPDAGLCRSALLIAFGGLAIALGTVFVWSGTYATLMFLLGSFAWLAAAPGQAQAAGPGPGTGTGSDTGPDLPGRARPRYSRFDSPGPDAEPPSSPPAPLHRPADDRPARHRPALHRPPPRYQKDRKRP